MGKTRKDKVKISFIGQSANKVTGSSYLIEYKDEKTLVDVGFVQHRNKLTQWQMNNENFKYKVKEIDNIILTHFGHLDHNGGLARLYANGCKAKIFATKGATEYLRIAFEDNLKIMQKDADYLSNTNGKKYKPSYTHEDVDRMLNSIIEVELNSKVLLGEYLTLRMTSAYHVASSAQVELFVVDEMANYRKKIYFSGDLGNFQIDKVFLEPFKPVENFDIGIVETTYAMNIKPANQKIRDKDREKLATIIRETCMENKGKVLIGAFAFSRAQELLYELFRLYGEDESFTIPIIVDSPLTHKITDIFDKLIPDKDQDLWYNIMSWKNITFTKDWEDSETSRRSKEPTISISASGFMDAGRIRIWLQELLPNPNNRIVFVGYSDEGSLASEIKEGKKKTINIDGIEVKNKAKTTVLNSFTSHIQHKDMLKLYSSFNCSSLYLVHGEKERQYPFAQLLEDECRKKNKTTKIFVPLVDDVIEF